MHSNWPLILVCGDPHGRFDHINHAVPELRPAAVILLGDNTPAKPLHEELAASRALTDIWWIHGNHDTDTEQGYDNLFASELGDRNLHGRVVDIAGVKVAGLGGVIRGRIWAEGDSKNNSPDNFVARCGKGNHWRKGMPLKHRSSIFPSEIAHLSSQRADILVTHEAPGGPDLHRHGFSQIAALARAMQVKAAFHA